MRIALLHYTYAPVIGGVEQVMEQHAALFRRAGHEVTVLAGDDLAPEGLEGRLAGQELVVAHNLLTMPFQPALTEALWGLAERWPQVRFVSWVHDVAAANPDYVLPPGGVFRAYCQHFEYVAVSEWRRRQLHEAMGVPLERCRVIPNGIAPLEHWQIRREWEPLIEKARLLERDLVLLHPARLVRRKNIELSLRVTAALRAAGCDAALLVTAAEDVHHAPSQAYAAEVRRLRETLDLTGHALFLTDFARLEPEDVHGFYRLADAVFFPSRQEGFGLPLLEAALHGKPLFCARIEPLTRILPAHAAYFEIGAAPEEIAATVRHRVESCAAIQARREGVRVYAWPAVYRNFIMPLLAERPPDPIS